MVDARHYFRTAFVLSVLLFLFVAFALYMSMQGEPEKTQETGAEGQNLGLETKKEGEKTPESTFSLHDVNIEMAQGGSDYTISDVNVEIG